MGTEAFKHQKGCRSTIKVVLRYIKVFWRHSIASDLIQSFFPWPMWTDHWVSELNLGIGSVRSISLIHEQIIQIGFLNWINRFIERSQVDSVINELFILSVNIEVKLNLLHTQRNHMASDLIQWYFPWPIWQIIEWSLNLGISLVRSISLIYEQIIQIGFLNGKKNLYKVEVQ